MEGGVYMTEQELDRAEIISEIKQDKISQVKAAEILGLSVRQVRRLYKAFLKDGIKALASLQRGKPSNHQLPPLLKEQVSKLITTEKYRGFGPTFMSEKLKQLHGISICPETTRQLMIQNGVWEANVKKSPVIHQQRPRRAQFGELVQIDGSPHAWFEERRSPCDLIVFIDDATGQTFGLFAESETTVAYMKVAWQYFLKYGRPLAFYSDKHGIFRVNKPGCTKRECVTQFGRAVKELGIESICANSPQAKGRVERGNQTHQDRLVKELRLADISTIEEANRFLIDKYWDEHNKKFAVVPKSKQDAHRKLLAEHELKRILCHKEYRVVSKNLEIQYECIIYQIVQEKPSMSMRKAQVLVLKGLDGSISIEYKGKAVPFKEYGKQEYVGKEISSKEIERFLREPKKREVPAYHPWRSRRSGIQKGVRRY